MTDANAKLPASPKAPDPYLGKLINGRFRVEQLIARGGMGRVYRAEQTPLGRTVALKVLDPRYVGNEDPQFEQRFFLEASVASKLHHPNTVTVFDYGRGEDDTYFIAMEYVDGESLLALAHRENRMPPGRVCNIALQIARSLREAHRLNVVHRDLKPANVLVTRHGDDEDFIKVLDFGLVKSVHEGAEEFTQAGLFMGSPKYMAPEQIRGESCDGRTDIYALGIVMYQLLSGRVPYDGDTSVKTLMAHMQEPVPAIEDSSVPESFKQFVYACMAKSPDDRPPSMEAVIQQLKLIGSEAGQSLLASGVHPITASGTVPIDTHSLATTPSQAFSGVHGLPGTTPSTGFGRPPRVSQSIAGMPIPAQVQSAEGAGSKRSQAAKLAVIAAVAVAGAFLGLRAIEPDGDPSLASAAAAPTETPEPPAAPAAAQPTSPEPEPEPVPVAEPLVEPVADPALEQFVLIQLTSDPAGATFSIDGEEMGKTPAQIELTGEQAENGRELHIGFSHRGYVTADVVRTVSDERLDVHASLARVHRARRRAAPARPSQPDPEPKEAPATVEPW